ncbi:MAG TPA: DinB family protein [Candidatus Acidoferrum sp.]|nr:DinB family protein [Candidatus Acidoferrum sp.]
MSDGKNMESKKLIQYTHVVRRRYLKIIGELPWDEVVKDRGASFPSIRDIFLHALDAEDLLINHIVQGKKGKWVSHDYGKFLDMHQIEGRVDDVEKNVDAYLKTVTGSELDRKVALPWRPSFPLRVSDVLITVATEDAYHMGELNALMWQFDKEPPFLSWSAFVEQNP